MVEFTCKAVLIVSDAGAENSIVGADEYPVPPLIMLVVATLPLVLRVTVETAAPDENANSGEVV